MAVDGNGTTFVVGAPAERSTATDVGGDETINTAVNAGAAYVFESSGAVVQRAYLKASNTGGGDTFGEAVALAADGNTIAVGAPREDSVAGQSDDSAFSAGAVYVFTKGAPAWAQTAFLKGRPESGDQFGGSLALAADGRTLAVGAPLEDSAAIGVGGDEADNNAGAAGAVYVFTRDATQWNTKTYVKASNTGESDQFGLSGALSGDGNTLAVGAPFEDNVLPGLANDGAVYIFTRSGASWSEQRYLKPSGALGDDHFGSALALSENGNTLVVAASEQRDRGAIYVYTRSGTTWTEQVRLEAARVGDEFGAAVSLSSSGDQLLVGAASEKSEATGIDGNRAPTSTVALGAAYLFERTGTAWAERAYIKASNTGVGNRFGASLGLSGNAGVVVVADTTEGSNARGINGDQNNELAGSSGAAYLYRKTP